MLLKKRSYVYPPNPNIYTGSKNKDFFQTAMEFNMTVPVPCAYRTAKEAVKSMDTSREGSHRSDIRYRKLSFLPRQKTRESLAIRLAVPSGGGGYPISESRAFTATIQPVFLYSLILIWMVRTIHKKYKRSIVLLPYIPESSDRFRFS